jgi:hypothetical protein
MSRIGLPARSGVGAPLPNPTGQSRRAAVPVSQARAEASRRNPGVALIRDGNATRSLDTLMRYRNAAMAEFTRALRTLQALQAGNGERNARPATIPAPKEPKKARNSRSLVSRTALVAAMPPAHQATDRTPPCPEPSLASLIRPALELLGARAAPESQTNPRTGLSSFCRAHGGREPLADPSVP